MSPYQQIFSTNAVLSVWRNLRNTKEHNDLLLTLQYHKDDARSQNGKKFGKNGVSETAHEISEGKAIDVGGKSIGFVVPWRSMQAQRKELREREKELAEALVMLAGEVAFTGMHLFALEMSQKAQSLQYAMLIPFQICLQHCSLHSPRTRLYRSVTLPLEYRAKCRRSKSKWLRMRPSPMAKTYIPAASLRENSYLPYKSFSSSIQFPSA